MPIKPMTSSAAAMHGAVVPIAYATGDGTNYQFNFGNIPQTYQDLQIIMFGNETSGTNNPYITLNGDYTANSGSITRLSGNGTSATSTRRSSDSVVYLNNPLANSSTIQASWKIDILNYRSSAYKTILWRFAQDLNGSGTTELTVGLKQLTAPVSSIFLQMGSALSASSTVALYGIRTVGQ